MLKKQVTLIAVFLFPFIWVQGGMAQEPSAHSKTCTLSSDDLFEATTRAECEEGNVFGSCWILGSDSFARGLGVGSAVALPRIAKLGSKTVEKAKAFDAGQSKYESETHFPRSGLASDIKNSRDGLVMNQTLDPDQLNKRLKESAKKFQQTMRSLGVPDLQIQNILGADQQYFLRTQKKAEIADRLNDIKTSPQEKVDLKKQLQSINKEINEWSDIRAKAHLSAKENFHASNRRYALTSTAFAAAVGVAVGKVFTLATYYFQTEKLAKCMNASDSEALDLRGYVTNEGGLLGDCHVGIPSTVLQKILQMEEATRSQFFLKNPSLCRLIQDQKKYHQNQQQAFVKNLNYKVESCKTESDGSLKVNYQLKMGEQSYEGIWSKKGNTSEVQSTLLPGTIAELGQDRTFSMAVDPQDGQFRSFQTSHPKVGSDWNVSNPISGGTAYPMENYQRLYHQGDCRFMNSESEKGNYKGSSRLEIGCSAARLIHAFNYISQGLVSQCAEQLQEVGTPSPKKSEEKTAK